MTDNLTARDAALFLNGEWHAGQGPVIPSIDPTTGKTFAEVASATSADVDAAARAAEAAFPKWSRLSGAERATYLRGIARGLEARSEALIALQMRNNGKPRAEAEIDVSDAVATFDYYAELAQDRDARQNAPVALSEPGIAGRTRFEPLGPCALIVPWNFPLVTTAWKLAPALAAGNTAILKPSELSTLAELVYGDIAQEIGLPAGVLSILPGGGEIGAAMCAAPQVAKISFTGSNATGGRVMAAAAQRTVPVSLELGGKSPIVVLPDADIDEAVELVVGGIFFNCGQFCSATSRLIVADEIADALIEALGRRIAAIRVGSDAEMGPATGKAQFDKIRDYFRVAEAEGLDRLCGGEALDCPGYFVAPTVYLDVPSDSRIWQEEIFGPVLATRRARDLEEAVRLANETAFGLAATVVGGDTDRAQAVADRIRAGHVWVNAPQIVPPNSAWGGFKASGIGRELGPWGLAAYSAVKHITGPA